MSNRSCIVCFDGTPNAVFMKCGHGGICYKCAIDIFVKNKECYLCREHIDEVLEIESTNESLIKVISTTKNMWIFNNTMYFFRILNFYSILLLIIIHFFYISYCFFYIFIHYEFDLLSAKWASPKTIPISRACSKILKAGITNVMATTQYHNLVDFRLN